MSGCLSWGRIFSYLCYLSQEMTENANIFPEYNTAFKGLIWIFFFTSVIPPFKKKLLSLLPNFKAVLIFSSFGEMSCAVLKFCPHIFVAIFRFVSLSSVREAHEAMRMLDKRRVGNHFLKVMIALSKEEKEKREREKQVWFPSASDFCFSGPNIEESQHYCLHDVIVVLELISLKDLLGCNSNAI